MQKFLALALERLQEPSTRRGLILIATGAGAGINPEQMEAIVSTGLLIAGLFGLVPDKK